MTTIDIALSPEIRSAIDDTAKKLAARLDEEWAERRRAAGDVQRIRAALVAVEDTEALAPHVLAGALCQLDALAARLDPFGGGGHGRR